MFNYTICENILYGLKNASNEQVYEAAKIANALEFIENQKISEAEFCEDPAELLKQMEANKEALIRVYGDEKEFEKKLLIVKEIADK